jgi:hypothetical protein
MRERKFEMRRREEEANMAQTVMMGALAFVLAYAFARNLPNIIRYIKISRM